MDGKSIGMRLFRRFASADATNVQKPEISLERQLTMKKSRRLSFIWWVLALTCFLNCKAFRRPRPAELAVPTPAKKPVAVRTHRPLIAAPVTVVPAKPTAAEQKPADNQRTVSAICPAPEFAIIQIDKTMPRQVELNQPFDYFITVTNLTNTPLGGIVITEELPANFKYLGSDPKAKENAANLVWEIQSMGPKTSRQIRVSGQAAGPGSLQLSTAVATHFIPVYMSIRVVQPKLELTFTAPDQAVLSDLMPEKFVVANTGTGSAENVRITQTLPPGLQTTDGRSELVFDAGTLTAGQSREFSANIKAVRTGKYTTQAQATATDLKPVSQQATIKVGQPILEISKVGPQRQYIDRPLTFEIKVANKGDAPAKDALLQDTIPQGVTSLRATAGARLYKSGKLLWKLGTLAPNASKKVRVSYIPTQAGTFTAKATATAYRANDVSATVTTSVTGISAALLEVVDVDDPVEVGSRTTYLIRVTNQGSATATGIQVSCTLEDNVRYISSTGATVGAVDGNRVNFAPLDSLAPKGRASWRVIVEALKPADTRFKVSMITDQLTRPVEETEATHLYK